MNIWKGQERQWQCAASSGECGTGGSQAREASSDVPWKNRNCGQLICRTLINLIGQPSLPRSLCLSRSLSRPRSLSLSPHEEQVQVKDGAQSGAGRIKSANSVGGLSEKTLSSAR
jgi:hypothetical protein